MKNLQLVVSSIEAPEPGIKVITLTDEDNWRLPSFRPGAHIDLYLSNGQIRTYSLCNEPVDDRHYIVAIKLEKNGRGGSIFIHKSIQLGDRVGVSVPRGGISTSDALMNVFIAGGIGITPFIPVIKEMGRNGKTNYVLHWFSRGSPGLKNLLSDEINTGKVILHNTLEKPVANLASILNTYGDQTSAYCCGPESMLDDFESIVSSLPADRVHTERFIPPKIEPSPEAVPFTVVLAKSGIESRVPPGSSLLSTLESLKANISVSCAGGICGACRTRWLEGSPIHKDRVLSPKERETELIICVAECASSRLVLDL